MSKIKELKARNKKLETLLEEGKKSFDDIEMELGEALFGYSKEGLPLWGDIPPRSLARLAVKALKSYEKDLNVSNRAVASREYKLSEYTCSGCPEANICPWAFDLYNTNGDCLGDK